MHSLMRRATRPSIATLLVVATTAASSPAAARDPALAKARFLDARLPVDRRVADLLGRMTLDEKIAQLHGYWRPKQDVLIDAAGKFPAGNPAT